MVARLAEGRLPAKGEQVNDRVSRILFESLTTDEEKHIDFLEAQLTLVEQLGAQLYAQKHAGEMEGD